MWSWGEGKNRKKNVAGKVANCSKTNQDTQRVFSGIPQETQTQAGRRTEGELWSREHSRKQYEARLTAPFSSDALGLPHWRAGAGRGEEAREAGSRGVVGRGRLQRDREARMLRKGLLCDNSHVTSDF